MYSLAVPYFASKRNAGSKSVTNTLSQKVEEIVVIGTGQDGLVPL
jgi:hypothetical protein